MMKIKILAILFALAFINGAQADLYTGIRYIPNDETWYAYVSIKANPSRQDFKAMWSSNIVPLNKEGEAYISVIGSEDAWKKCKSQVPACKIFVNYGPRDKLDPADAFSGVTSAIGSVGETPGLGIDLKGLDNLSVEGMYTPGNSMLQHVVWGQK